MENKRILLPELLAPAGNLERLEAAFRFGADAVYLGAQFMSLRNFADNFAPDELKSACRHAHGMSKKVYLAANSFAHDKDICELESLFQLAVESEVDALIVNDPGVIYMARRIAPQLELHLSTQANTLSSAAALFWHETAGVKRVILARELSIDEIRKMRETLPSDIELEMFVHGAMCISYSGRCLLSNYLTGRDSNKGECAQPCRWSYEIRETGKNGEFFPVVQDDIGTHILNSRDMNLLERLPEVISTGVSSIKIEGRMKSVLYVATVVNCYRTALDIYADSVKKGVPYELPTDLVQELMHVSHRPYTTGFAFSEYGRDRVGEQMPLTSKYVSDSDICAVVLDYDAENKLAYLRQRNRFFVGDTLSILSPGDYLRSFVVESIKDDDGEYLQSAPHPNQHLTVPCTQKLKVGDILRCRKVIRE